MDLEKQGFIVRRITLRTVVASEVSYFLEKERDHFWLKKQACTEVLKLINNLDETVFCMKEHRQAYQALFELLKELKLEALVLEKMAMERM